MVDLLNCCDIVFATLANHEFDFGPDVLWTRLAESHWVHVLANLDAPRGHALPRLAFWPPKGPFLAITGLVGSQTIGEAVKAGFKPVTPADLESFVSTLTAEKGGDAVVVDFGGNSDAWGNGMDATDASLRWKSTDCGNFVADAVRAATGADLALLNAGAFRIDRPAMTQAIRPAEA